MKKAIIIPLLFTTLFAFSQGSNITFVLSKGVPNTKDILKDLELPLKISFTKDFDGKELILKDSDTKFKINDKQVLGKYGLKFNENGLFEYLIDQDRKTNPG
jgi:hypothetical protein